MIKQSNKSSGSKFEWTVAERLQELGWWVHLLVQGLGGQPADMIACKNGKAFLIDAKECKSRRFPLNRIEDNQRNAMTLFNNLGNNKGYFALGLDNEIYMFSIDELEEFEKNKKSLNAEDIRQGEKIERWGF